MNRLIDFALGDSTLCRHVKRLGFERFQPLAGYVRRLPYKRVAHADAIEVLRAQGGTCSVKHRLLSQIARESEHFEVKLTIGMYAMSECNTPGVGRVLKQASLAVIPEAHCYLTVHDQRLDFTGLEMGRASPFETLCVERFVDPEQLARIKPAWHREYIGRWARARGLSGDDVWRVREQCIAALVG